MENHFQVVILGTGLAESIAAAALAKAGFSVAHLDPNPYYGSGQASLSADELIQWADEQTASHIYTNITHSQPTPPDSRRYALSLTPSIIPSVGPLISALVASGVARYGGYKLLERTAIYDPSGTLQIVPGSKEDVFKNKDMSLIDKRRLMRFLMFAASEFEEAPELKDKEETPFVKFLKNSFSLPDKAANAISYALAFRSTPYDPTLPALKHIRSVLRSSGRYGSSPFIVGHYGGTGEIAQGFCRTAAVNGGVYILGRPTTSITPKDPSADGLGSYDIKLADIPDTLTCDVVLSAPELLPATLREQARTPTTPDLSHAISIARCIAIFDTPIYFDPPTQPTEVTDNTDADTSSPEREPVDTALLVFPPASVSGGSADVAATVLINGEASISTPEGKWVAYISIPIKASSSPTSAEELLKPYLTALTALTAPSSSEPIFTTLYTENPSSHSPPLEADDISSVLVTPDFDKSVAGISDSAARAGEALFWAAVKTLKTRGIRPKLVKNPAAEGGGNAGFVGEGESGEEEREEDVWPGAMWPPLEAVGDDDDL